MANNTTQLITVASNILLPSILFKFIAMIIGVLGNITVIIHTIFTSKEKTTTSYLVANLALADLLVCLTFYPIGIIEFIQTISNINGDQELFCRLSRSIVWALLFASVLTLLAITVDRYFYIAKPLKYPLIVTRRRVFVAISGIWVISGFIFIALKFYYQKSTTLRSYCHLSPRGFLLMNIFVVSVLLIPIFILNFRILNVARKQRKRILAETTVTVNMSNEQSSNRLVDLVRLLVGMKAVKTFCIIFAVLTFCVFTPTIIGLTLKDSCSEFCLQIWYVVFHYEFYGLNSVVNAFIYGMRHIKYRKAYENIFFKIFL